MAAILAGSACGDDGVSTSFNFGDGTEATSAGTGASMGTASGADTTETASASAGSGSATDTTSGDTETGGEALPGQTMSQLVSSGTRSTSATYLLVYTFGQPSQLQSTHRSASYRLRGGLAGANGSPP